MQSALASLVKTYQLLEKEKVYREAGLDCTKKSSEQLTMYDLLGCSSKTPLQSALEAVTSSSQTLWREDIPGETDELLPLMPEPHTSGTGGSVLPDGKMFLTQKASESGRGERSETFVKRNGDRGEHCFQSLSSQVQMMPTPTVCGNYNRKGSSKTSGDGLATFVAKWPTPTKSDGTGGPGCSGRMGGANLRTAVKTYPTPTRQDAKNNGSPSQQERNTKPLNAEVGGPLNPEWVEWLMGWPIGHTELASSETAKFRSRQRSRGKSLEGRK
jgi:hypothetical protein